MHLCVSTSNCAIRWSSFFSCTRPCDELDDSCATLVCVPFCVFPKKHRKQHEDRRLRPPSSPHPREHDRPSACCCCCCGCGLCSPTHISCSLCVSEEDMLAAASALADLSAVKCVSICTFVLANASVLYFCNSKSPVRGFGVPVGGVACSENIF